MFIENEEEMPKLSERTKIEYICESCGKEVNTIYRSYKLNPKLLCKSCKIKDKMLNSDKSLAVLKREETCLKKYGVRNPQQSSIIRDKTKETISKKTSEELEEIKNKAKETRLKKYGAEFFFQTDEFKNKAKETCIKKYGVDNYSKSDEFKKRNILILQELVDKNRETIHNNNLEFMGFNDEIKNLKFRCKECHTEFNGRIYNKEGEVYISKCPICFNNFKTSSEEKEMTDFIESVIDVERNKKFGIKYEIDCFIPSKNIGFEYDGLYWHSSLFKDDDYHYNKNLYFNKLGIKIYHIYSDEWLLKKDIVKSIIKSKLNVYDNVFYARKLIIKDVPKKDEKDFLNENHIQGFTPSSICLGLYNDDELISLMSFGKSRFSKKFDYELLRFVNKKYTKVIGGASKLFSSFIRKYNNSNIISYCDLRLFDGEVYNKLGFKYSHDSAPNYYYVKDNERFNRIKFQKHKLKKIFPKSYSDDKTEKQIMNEENYCYINDCGMGVYVF